MRLSQPPSWSRVPDDPATYVRDWRPHPSMSYTVAVHDRPAPPPSPGVSEVIGSITTSAVAALPTSGARYRACRRKPELVTSINVNSAVEVLRTLPIEDISTFRRLHSASASSKPSPWC
jgi:hypothetical protein